MDPFYASVREMRASMVSVEVIRRNFAEWDVSPYQYQKSNMDESENWCHPFWTANHANGFRKSFTETCKRYESFDFSIEPVVDGRLFRGTIVEGSVSRPAIVKTWDYLLPMELENGPRLYKFCDEIELLTNERANKHPNLVKFYKCCFDRRLAVVYDAEFTRVLSDVLLDDDFGWDKRIKVAIQLADLLSWLHKNGIAVGSVTIECIMIDDEVNIKVFDFGYVSNHVNEDTTISALVRVGQEAPEIFSGTRTMKSDVYIFGLLLLQLIANKEVICDGPDFLEQRAIKEAKRGKKYLVRECFKEVDHSTAFEITLLAFRCLHIDRPDWRPKMDYVLNALTDLRDRARGEIQNRDEIESQRARI